MTTIRSIAAKDVMVGDFIYNSSGYCESAKWLRVTRIFALPGTLQIEAELGFTTFRHLEEGIGINVSRRKTWKSCQDLDSISKTN